MLNCIRTNSENTDFQKLVAALDAELRIRDGEDHAFYAQFNKTNQIRYVIVAYLDGVPVGCGALKEFAPDTMEVKRMFVAEEHRGKGIASRILSGLEDWARELHYTACVLETGQKQPEAIALYIKSGYHAIPNYGQYAHIINSVCFEKRFI